MSFANRAFSGLRVAAIVVGAGILAAAGVGYWFYISQQRQYIVGRDFRVLANLVKQVDTTVQNEATVIQNMAADAWASPDGKSLADRWVRLRGRPDQIADIKFKFEKVSADATRYRFSTNDFAIEVPLRLGDETDTWVATLKLQRGLEPMFTSRVRQGAFDAILLGNQDGKVLLSAGQSAQQIRSSGLGVLFSKTTDGRPLMFSELSQSMTMADVSLGGVDYTVFLFPCRLSPDSRDKTFVLMGLVRADTLRSGSWAISTTLVKISMLGVLVAIVAWPFLRLILLGDRQQVRTSDFFQLGASSVAGLAIVTMVLLDVSAYLRLNRDIDVQLKGLADDLDGHATAEIWDAYEQLRCLEHAMGSLDAREFKDGRLSSALENPALTCESVSTRKFHPYRRQAMAENQLEPSPPFPWAYPFFEFVAFIDRDGVQQVKLGTSRSVSNRIKVSEREYFQTIMRGHGWNGVDFCHQEKCALESVWSWTIGEPLAVLAKESSLKWPAANPKPYPVAAISIPMRSLIGPVLPPGFVFAVIDHMGKVLFHSDRQRNGNEDFFVETDNNRRLRAQIAAHSAEPLNISYWGSEYRAYVKPMAVPHMYVVAMAEKERAWAINREWLVVALIFVAIYLALWLVTALITLGRNASWVWPDPQRRSGYLRVSGLCGILLVAALVTAWFDSRNYLLTLGTFLPLVGWTVTFLLLKDRANKTSKSKREPLVAYSCAAVLVLLVTGVVPGALLFLASYQLHARSYIKNSQLMVARQLSDRFDRLNEAFLSPDNGLANPRKKAASQVGRLYDRDVYVDFLNNTSIKRVPTSLSPSATGAHTVSQEAVLPPPHTPNHDDDMVLSFLEDYLPYYSEASVEWRELLHDGADDGSWKSEHGRKGKIVFTSKSQSLPVELTSWVPTITRVPPPRQPREDTARAPEEPLPGGEPQPVATTFSEESSRDESRTRDSSALLLFGGIALLALAWGAVQMLKRHIFLVGISEPLWACSQLAGNAGENVLVLCDKATKANQIAGITPLKLGPIVQEPDVARAWRRELLALDQRTADGAVLIDDFDEGLDDGPGMHHKLVLLDELVSDPSRMVILLSQVSVRGLTDSLRHSARVISATGDGAPGQKAADIETSVNTLERWRRILKAFVVVERRESDETRQQDADKDPPAPLWSDRFDERRKVVAFLKSEGGPHLHPYVRRICQNLLDSSAVKSGDLTRRQAFDEVAERTAQFYRGLWASCSEDEKVVLGHIAEHGLANASVRGVVRRLLGRRLLCKDPALRPMNETFRRFVLTRECSRQVAALEIEDGLSTWDRLRVPLGIGVVGVAVFLFATQKELYNAILGITTAAAASVPTLIRAVTTLVGRPVNETGSKA